MKAQSLRGASTRQKIVEAAAKLIQRQGVNGTSVDDVLGASGTGKSQFYHYFTSKEALVRELAGFLVDGLPSFREGAVPAADGHLSLAAVEAWLDRIGQDLAAGVYACGCPVGNLAAEMATQHDELRQQLSGILSGWEAQLGGALAQLKAQGIFRQDVDPSVLATFVIASLEGAMLLSKTHARPEPLVQTIGQLKAYLQAQTTALPKPGKAADKRFGATAVKPRPLSFCP